MLNLRSPRGPLLFVAYNQLSTTLYFMHMHIAHASFFRTCAIHAISIPTNCILHYFVFKCGTLSRGVPIHGPPAWKSVECAAAQLSWIGIRPTELNWRVTFPLLYALGISILTGTELRVRNLTPHRHGWPTGCGCGNVGKLNLGPPFTYVPTIDGQLMMMKVRVMASSWEWLNLCALSRCAACRTACNWGWGSTVWCSITDALRVWKRWNPNDPWKNLNFTVEFRCGKRDYAVILVWNDFEVTDFD